MWERSSEMKPSIAPELRAKVSELRSTPSGRTAEQNSLFRGRRSWGNDDNHEFEGKEEEEEEEAALFANVLNIFLGGVGSDQRLVRHFYLPPILPVIPIRLSFFANIYNKLRKLYDYTFCVFF